MHNKFNFDFYEAIARKGMKCTLKLGKSSKNGKEVSAKIIIV